MHVFWRVLAALLVPTSVFSAELQPHTAAAFDRYVAATEARIDAEISDAARHLRPDLLASEKRSTTLADIREGRLYIERLATTEGGRTIEVPDGMMHHWVGLIFVPGKTTREAVALLQDYDRHATIYAPAVQQSRVLARDGDSFRVFLRFFMKKVLTVVMDTENDARFTTISPDFVHSRIVSTRITEVENPGTPQEREKPVGNDSGFMWRLNTYWRFVERDGGVYVQCESVSLSRGIPAGLGWLIGPFVTDIPRESLTFTLETTRRTLLRTGLTAAIRYR